ncbi:hypothetical protein QYE76_064514 [Lolium multiflorum]|uniref:Uncharacterized protein n=1 Tax=Lolium multiflorum TaxID=4521 RepID=A0AAD8S6Z8_LOLMU|nr:hypothetical protein QYE76_064514 [Lolium multiflorum]
MMGDAHKEADRIRREAIAPRKINFATPTDLQPLTTQKDNMKKAAELLARKDEEIDINHLRTLVASAMKQQSKADTSCGLESNPEHCVSTTQKDASGRQHRDDESRTGSTECRRRTREHPNPIPVPSETYPTDRKKGKGPMYTSRDKYRNPSPPPRIPHPPPPPCRRSPVENTRPHGPGGINIRDNAPPQRNRNTERTPEPRRRRNEEREPEQRRSRNDGGDPHQGEGSHRSRSQPQEGRRESEGGSKRSHRPPHISPSPPPSGGGGGRRSRSRSKSPRSGSRDAREHLNEYRSKYIGPKCFGRMIREKPTPKGLNLKLPGNLKHYDGSERPDTWIENYFNPVSFSGGNQIIACRMVQLYLIGPARTWLCDLEENSIFCWFNLKIAFEKHFRGTYKRTKPSYSSENPGGKYLKKSNTHIRRLIAHLSSCRFRCSKLWLKGDNAGRAETFIDNLPGSEVALDRPVHALDLDQEIPRVLPGAPPQDQGDGQGSNMVAQVSESGEIIRLLDDSMGKVINFMTSVAEFDGDLYFGSLLTNFVGKLSLAKLYLIGPARTWLCDLEENSIFCWFNLKIAFEKHFRGTYKRTKPSYSSENPGGKYLKKSNTHIRRLIAFLSSCRFRCSKLWLKGDNAGRAETFIDNLPGCPDNIRLASEGSFWIALLPVFHLPPHLGFICISPYGKQGIRVFCAQNAAEVALDRPVHALDLDQEIPRVLPGAPPQDQGDGQGSNMVAQVSESGEIIRLLDDSQGKVINFMTSVAEFDGDLYFGSLLTNFVGKLSLAKVVPS